MFTNLTCSRLLLAVVSLLFASFSSRAEPPPIKAFARMPAFENLLISADGRHLAYKTSRDDHHLIVVADITGDTVGNQRVVLADIPGKFEITWCNWANNSRLLCGLLAMATEAGNTYPVTRLVGVDADGQNRKTLLQYSDAAYAQLQDRVLDWTPDQPDSVLLELDDDGNGFPSVFELNVYTGSRKLRVREHAPIRSFFTDGHGVVRLGQGLLGKEYSYYARLNDDSEWHLLTKFAAFTEPGKPTPLRVESGTNKSYATAPYNGRDALYEMDLTDTQQPRLLFSHPQVDAASPRFAPDGRLLGVFYETDRPFMFYTDPHANSVAESARKALGDAFVVIGDYTLDEQIYSVEATSDVDAGTTYLFFMDRHQLLPIGRAYPELDPALMSRKRSITYTASDGTSVPGYLIVPNGVRPDKLPLIVMPHGGPVARDSWAFDFLEQFLASRGYAVLQMNFRGSDGYGRDWYYQAHQDWGGLTYSDIRDGARWAIEQGIADPQHMCILGWSFGGYAALLGAVRDSGMYKCAVSIAGVSDLPDLINDEQQFVSGKVAREQIGTRREKLIADSPRRHAADVNIPVLMIHGTRDYQVDVDHSRRMASALKSAHKSYRLVEIENGTHQLTLESQRVTLLTEVEKFLEQNLKAK
jgi:dipeptidyl aminopeptidase/acylaminoacyl peptidase